LITLAPGQGRTTSVQIESLDSATAVSAAEAEIATVQATVDPVVHDQPNPTFSDC